MTYNGKTRNGQVVFDEPVPLPEGTPVQVWEPLESTEVTAKTEDPSGKSLQDFLAEFAGTVELPADFAAEHDHYIHGTPRRKPLP